MPGVDVEPAQNLINHWRMAFPKCCAALQGLQRYSDPAQAEAVSKLGHAATYQQSCEVHNLPLITHHMG